MKEKVYIGIDPGKAGFICILAPYEEIEFIPIQKDPKAEFDLWHIRGVIEGIFTRFEGMDIIVGIESVHALFGASAGSTFNFGYITGVLNGLVAAKGVTIVNPQPKEWQKVMWEGVGLIKKKSSSGKTEVTDTKATSIKACKKLFPTVDLRRTERSTKMDDNKCDSLLIAMYLKRKNF